MKIVQQVDAAGNIVYGYDESLTVYLNMAHLTTMMVTEDGEIIE